MAAEPKNMTQEELQAEFKKYDTDGNGTIDEKELEALLVTSLHQKIPAGLLNKYKDLQLNNADKDKNGLIDFEEFCMLYKQLAVDPELPIKLTAPVRAASAPIQVPNDEDVPKVEKAPEIQLTEEERAAALESFAEHDTDKSGSIDKAELTVLLKSRLGKRMGEKMIERYVETQFSHYDKDQSGTIDQDEYLRLYATLILKKDDGSQPVRAGSAKIPGMY